ncbi:heparan-alpha-glucosaminide N-acetyltransferase domain-containing protein [Niabella ginsengisoli]|uniref:DUF1624 domain-containing protein n=1 Tax=Niabella ginsengisoli TaxID=522298 RepID=A0ABS9SMD0_9BACT|nr:heparan-alpha-glucosaminide N-acetyltransferase domain-containing protein [Niabella ginsengisoli]MCH5599510.1 DUF1624 domain-containing protein [Niabella ginsengisoli]
MLTEAQRRGLALARGFIVLIMPAVHTVWLYSNSDVKQGWLGLTLGFLSEGPGAQLFMFLMGLFIVTGRRKPARFLLKRALILLFTGYMLNLFKLVIPFYAGWIPPQFFIENGLIVSSHTPLQLLLVGDILQFAAIAYPLCAWIAQQNKFLLLAFIVMAIVLLISPVIWELKADAVLLKTPLLLLNGAPPLTFFPLFPWLFYPLMGLITGGLVKKYAVKLKGYQLLIAGITMLLSGWLLTNVEPVAWQQTFYRLGRGGTLMHGGIVLLWLALFLWLAKHFKQNHFFSLLDWLSRSITIIYLLQWVVVFWMLPLFGYNRLSLLSSLTALLITSVVSFGTARLLQKLVSKTKPNTHAN